jgi:hypothetical protein
MSWHACSKALPHAVLAAGLIVGFVPFAMADEASYCVTCTGPDQTYVCKVVGEDSRPSDALKLYCVIRTAKEGHHASCSAERSSPGCKGVEKVYSYDGPLIPPDVASDARVKHFMDKVAHDQKTFAKPKGEAPKTLAELTGRAVNASRQGWRSARAAIGGSEDQAPAASSAPSAPQPLPASSEATGSAESAAPPSRTERAKHAAQNASSAVGGFARKSYRCLRSFFRACSETTQGQAVQSN